MSFCGVVCHTLCNISSSWNLSQDSLDTLLVKNTEADDSSIMGDVNHETS